MKVGGVGVTLVIFRENLGAWGGTCGVIWGFIREIDGGGDGVSSVILGQI